MLQTGIVTYGMVLIWREEGNFGLIGTTDGTGEILLGLPLIPLPNHALSMFGKKMRQIRFVGNLQWTWIPASVQSSRSDCSYGYLPKELFEKLTNIACVGDRTLCCFTYTLLAQQLFGSDFAARMEESRWCGMETGFGFSTSKWGLVDVVFGNTCKRIAKCCQALKNGLCFQWLVSSHLCQLWTQLKSTKIIRSSSVEGTLVKLGCKNGLGVEEHQQLPANMHGASAAAGVLHMLFGAAYVSAISEICCNSYFVILHIAMLNWDIKVTQWAANITVEC